MKTRVGEEAVIVAGVGQTPFNRRRDGTGIRDWAVAALDAALDMAGLARGDLDALVIASESDMLTAQPNPAGVLADELGLAGVAAWRVEGGGASGQLAVHSGVRAILAGQAARVAVVGLDPSASALAAGDVAHVYSISFDALAEGLAGLTATEIYALSFRLFAAETGLGAGALADITRDHRARACANPDAHLPRRHTVEEIAAAPIIAAPYRRLHCAPFSDGAAAVILCRRRAAPATRAGAPRVSGIGAASDRVHLGARARPERFDAKGRALARATTMAGITPGQIGLAEIYDPYAGAALQALDALGLSTDIAGDLAAGAFERDGRLPVNLSGGLLGQGAPAGAVGVAQTGACARLLEGCYHPGAQPAAEPAHALADTHGGIATTCAATILSVGAG